MDFVNFLNTTVLDGVNAINGVLTDYVLVVLLIATGLYISIRTHFVQIRCFGEGWHNLFGNFSLKGNSEEGSMSSFQSLCTAVGGQVGTGNIVGVCGAVLVGGPGSIFWIWIIAFFGMATNYAEAVLAQKTKIKDADGNTLGGPVYYIKAAFNGGFGKFLAGFFAVAITLALGIMGCMVQSNAIAGVISNASGGAIPTFAIGLVVVALCLWVFLGGTNRLASITEKIVPIMAIFYIVGALAVLLTHIPEMIQAFGLIFTYAFTPWSATGGVVFSVFAAISKGANRGLFANEAGMGSTPHAHALANVEKPHDQGVVAMMGVFICSYFVVTLTGIVVVTTLFTGDNAVAHAIATNGIVGLDEFNKNSLAQLAFSALFGQGIANWFVAIALFFFAFSTIIAWNLFGKINMQYLFGKKAVIPFCILACVCMFIGSLVESDLVWALADFFNMIMVIPNVAAVIALGGVVGKVALGKDNEFGLQK
ncbi:MAG: amino acid carrier protein [Phoenicibacter congonensis]|uniref:Amino acid carrier protein n=1 Tax=Phoenicibacter congonensis TaxID=1944646 RepID=A0AA43UA74_9ACTN|nr:amino acid carrier protein [Phoenicibacter congonensis]